MKTMKSFGFFLMLLVLGVGFSSCGDDYESRLPELLIKNPLEFESSKDDITLSQVFRNEDLTNYGISSEASWCDPWIDYETSTIYVKVLGRGQSTDEDPYSDRSCNVTLTDIRDNTVRSFTVTQKQLNEILINGDEAQVPSDGGDVPVELQYNVSYQVSIPEDASWITEKKASGTRGLEKATVTLSVAENNSGSARSAIVSIKSTDGKIERNFRILQAFSPVLTIDPKEFTVDELSQTISINVTANFKLETYPEEDWVTTGGRETVDDTHFVQKINISAFTEKKENRASTVEFYANVKTAEGTYREIKETVKITQERTFYIPADTVKLEVGDSTVVELFNKNKLEAKWSTSDDQEFTVDSKGQIKCVGADGDGKATITVKSKDGKYSDQVIAVANKVKDMSKFLTCKWDKGTEVVGTDTTYTVGCTISMAEGGPTISLKGYTFYNDSTAQKTVSWDGKTLSAKGSVSTSDVSLVKELDYYVDWKYTYAKEDYILRFSMDGKITITKQTPTPAPAPAATRRSSRSRR